MPVKDDLLQVSEVIVMKLRTIAVAIAAASCSAHHAIAKHTR
jgi:hypothetical protein